MLSYYLSVAARGLMRKPLLTALMIATIGIGIGSSMTSLTIFRAMAADPIPSKSTQLFVPQIDNWGRNKSAGGVGSDNLPEQLTYRDAVALITAHAARQQTAMYATGLALTSANSQLQPFQVSIRATYTDFFSMFQVPFRYGSAWSAADDDAHAPVVVISKYLNDKEFSGTNSVGKTLTLGNRDYRVIGVLDHWNPLPRFYDLNNAYGRPEEVFVPFTRAIDAQMLPSEATYCSEDASPGWIGRLRSNCVWIQFWVQLPNASAVARYRSFLNNYASEQQRAGRFDWSPHVALRDVRQWLDYTQTVPNDVRIILLASFGFLFVCLVNAIGLMLAKFMAQARDLSLRRALGATYRAILVQCLLEAGMTGVAGGTLGLALTALGLHCLRVLVVDRSLAVFTNLDVADANIAVLLAIVLTTIAGLYPSWRVAQIRPVRILRTQ